MALPPAGQPGHGSTAILRNQPVRTVDGRFEGCRIDVYELVCPSCGDGAETAAGIVLVILASAQF
jgi:hypothetical protein